MARSCSGWSTANYFSRADTAISNEPITMACWFRPSALTANMVLMHLGDGTGTSAGYRLLVDGATANDPVVASKTTAGSAKSASVASTGIANGTWALLAGVFTSTTRRDIYIVPTLGGTLFTNFNTTSAGDPVVTVQTIGARQQTTITAPAAGSIAVPTIWTAALSVDEVTALGGGVHPARIRPTSIARAWWNPTAGSRLVDFSGGQNILTLTGTVTDDAFGPPVEPFPFYYPQPWMSNSPEIGVAAGGNAVGVGLTHSVALSRRRLAA